MSKPFTPFVPVQDRAGEILPESIIFGVATGLKLPFVMSMDELGVAETRSRQADELRKTLDRFGLSQEITFSTPLLTDLTNGLEKLGLADFGSMLGIRGKEVTTIGLTDRGCHLGVAACGAVLEWTKANPKITLPEVIGYTDVKGKTMQTRFGTLYALENAFRNGKQTSPSHIYATFGEAKPNTTEYRARLNAITGLLALLEKNGVVRTQPCTEYNDRIFTITDHHVGPRRWRSDVAEEVHRQIGILREAGKSIVNFEMLCRSTHDQLVTAGQVISYEEVKQKLHALIANQPSGSMPDIKKLDTFNTGSYTKVTVTKAGNDFIRSILELPESLRDPNRIAEHKENGRKLLADTETGRVLLQRIAVKLRG